MYIKGLPFQYPDYVTISHVWGTTTPTDLLGVKVPLSTGDDKAAVLEQLLTSNAHVWLDILSIDQHDDDDVALQVSCMGDIYRNAVRCFVICDDQLWAAVTSIFRDVSDLLYNYGCGECIPGVPREEVPVLEWEGETGLDAYWNSTYNTRVWTLQELALSQSVTFVHSTLDANGCLKALTFDTLLYAASDLSTRTCSCTWERDADCRKAKDTLRSLGIGSARGLQNEEVCREFIKEYLSRSRQCSVDRDVIFGVVGLLHGVPQMHYKKDSLELCIEKFALWLQRMGLGDLDVLSKYMHTSHRSATPNSSVTPTSYSGEPLWHALYRPNNYTFPDFNYVFDRPDWLTPAGVLCTVTEIPIPRPTGEALHALRDAVTTRIGQYNALGAGELLPHEAREEAVELVRGWCIIRADDISGGVEGVAVSDVMMQWGSLGVDLREVGSRILEGILSEDNMSVVSAIQELVTKVLGDCSFHVVVCDPAATVVFIVDDVLGAGVDRYFAALLTGGVALMVVGGGGVGADGEGKEEGRCVVYFHRFWLSLEKYRPLDEGGEDRMVRLGGVKGFAS
ncbi:hypothetical protein HDV00_004042 [Rhizophlyctis rosea]|nr:hypothetical protein HDV00_004042 [Rhizophlyctis rosea]